MKKKKKNKTSKLEKFIYKSFVFTTVVLIVGIIYRIHGVLITGLGGHVFQIQAHGNLLPSFRPAKN